MKMNNLIKYLLIIILGLALFLRVFKLDTVPPSLSWDEADVGYNAYSIANYANDEWGNYLPLVFKSFEDDKNPVHIYATAVFVKILGLSDLSVRLPVAVFGTLNVLLIFFLGKRIFRSSWVGILAALFLAISPYNIQFSRFNHEADFALFFFMAGLLMFLKGIEQKNYLLSLSFLSFGLGLLSYHSSKVVIPVVVLSLVVLYWRQLMHVKGYFIVGCLLIALVLGAFLLNPALFGTSRLKQTQIPRSKVLEAPLFKSTQSEFLGWLQVVGERYFSHFSPEYLFVSGDKIARHSSQGVGEFYKLDAIFLIIGFFLLLLKKDKSYATILIWALIAPFPAAVSGGGGEVPHAARALFMMGGWHLIAAYGFYRTTLFIKDKRLKTLFVVVVLVTLSLMFKNYLQDYYTNYPSRSAVDWQYGMKQIVEYTNNHPIYSQVYMTAARHQPYIFFLYYLKTPLPEFLGTVVYNNEESRTYNLVNAYNHYFFGNWDTVESMPNVGVLYILTPTEYDGLRHKLQFSIKEVIKYPNGENAFFIISAQ